MTTLVRIRSLERFLAVAMVLGIFARPMWADDFLSGANVYRAKCASCHGANGEGKSESYPNPLFGDKSIGELTEYISKSMPEDKPGTCTGEEASQVAQFIHGSFYSPSAQARNKPVRVELSRLTVRQYRNTIADLVAHFRKAGTSDNRHGLSAKYFKTREFTKGDLAFERLDSNVAFDFSDKSPDAEKIPPHEFAIRWEGAVIAPDTGMYEFHVHTDHSFRLWINDLKNPLIDSYVKSKTEADDRASIYLIGGRAFPLRLEFSKAKQGVQDGKAKEMPSASASISLLWKQPHRVNEVIPSRYLSPNFQPQVCIVGTPFPPDDRSSGWERATSISKEWDQATTEAAIELAAYIDAHLEELSGVNAEDPDLPAKLKDFCGRFTELAFRRPLDKELRQLYVNRQFEQTPDPKMAVNRVVLLVLKSPRFLYREVGAGSAGINNPYDVAARMSFGLWDSLPDTLLLEAAASGSLANREQVVAQAERMVSDPRTFWKVREFLLRWMKVDRVLDLSKDPEQFPDFSPLFLHDLRTSLELFLDELLVSESADFRQLLLSDSLFLNGRLAKFYGTDLPTDAEFQKVSLNTNVRAGILTHPYLLSSFAYSSTSSPIHRGTFLARSVLGRTLRPPPEAVAPLAPQMQPNLTTRDRVAFQTGHESCQSCHSLINPLGFTLEHFDAMGRFRNEEDGKPVMSSGNYRTRQGDMVQFEGARDLARFLANSSECHAAFVQQLFQAMIKQPIRAYGSETKEMLRQSFEQNHFNIRRLLVEIIATSALISADSK